MLDLELISQSGDALDVVSLEEMKKHLRIDNTKQDDEIEAAIEEAVGALHGRDGDLNRTILPCTWIRWLPGFPQAIRRPYGQSVYPRRIYLPYPPVTRVVSIFYEDANGSSPAPELDATKYVARTHNLVGEVELLPNANWPTAANSPRAVGIMYEAGYTKFPPILKRLVKILAADFVENKEASINERMQSLTSRKISYGVEYCMSKLRVPVALDDWEND